MEINDFDPSDDVCAADLPIMVEREVEYISGKKEVRRFYVKAWTNVELRLQLASEASSDPEVVARALARLISKSLCKPGGGPLMAQDKAEKIAPFVAGQLRELIMEVNGLGKSQE